MSSKIATFQDLQNMGATFNTSPSNWNMCATMNSALTMTDNVQVYGSYSNNQLIAVSDIGIIMNSGQITVDWSTAAPEFTLYWLAVGNYVYLDAIDAGYKYLIYAIPPANFGTSYMIMYYHNSASANWITCYDSNLSFVNNLPAAYNYETEQLFYGYWGGTPDAQIHIYT